MRNDNLTSVHNLRQVLLGSLQDILLSTSHAVFLVQLEFSAHINTTQVSPLVNCSDTSLDKILSSQAGLNS